MDMKYKSGANKDQELVKEGRKNTLQDVEAPARERVVADLVKQLEKAGEGHRTVEIWNTGNMRRANWLRRQEQLLQEYDEFLDPIYDSVQDWSSTLHLPITFTVAKTVHARMLSALLDLDPPFVLKAREASNEERVPVIQDFMRWAIRSWCNEWQGVEDELDAWIWRWVVGGTGILKNRWDRKYTRFVDVVEEPVARTVIQLNEEGEEVTQEVQDMVEVEKKRTIEIFNGPAIENRSPEDVLIIGGGGNPQKADEVIDREFLTAGQMWALVDQGIFREKAVKKAIEFGESYIGGDAADGVKLLRAENAGITDPNSDVDAPRYEVLERYARIDVDGSGIPSDVILWVHKESGEILRATYLLRVSRTGLRPFSKIDFHKRHGEDYGVGLAELLYTLQKEIDAIHNMKVDFGLISSMPWGFYRATSMISEERMPLEPGVLVPLDNPQTDVFFPNLGNKAAFNAQEEQFLLAQIERLTSISDLNLGVVGGQGVTRTATGTRALVGESNSNLNVFLRRMNRGWKQCLINLFHMLQQRVPVGLQYRVTGDDGNAFWRQIRSRDELAGMYDFELEANSANSNASIQQAVATEVYQMTGNPLDIQLGLITPLERYEALRNYLQTRGIRDYNRFLRKPTEMQRIFTPEEVANRILRGIDVRFTPEQDLQGFIGYFQEIIKDDELLGQFNEEQTIALAKKAQEAQAMLQAMQQQAAQQRNQQQVATNSGLSSGMAVPFNAPTGGMIGEQ